MAEQMNIQITGQITKQILKNNVNDIFIKHKKLADPNDGKILLHYKGSLADTINHYLVSQSVPRNYRNYAVLLNHIIMYYPKSTNYMTLYRGLKITTIQTPILGSISLLNMFKTAEFIHFRNFMSTSISQNIAYSFSINDEENHKIMLKIIIPDDFSLLCVDEIIETFHSTSRKKEIYENEYEILLPMNLTFYIQRIKCELINNDLVHVITLFPYKIQKKPEKMGPLSKSETEYLSHFYR